MENGRKIILVLSGSDMNGSHESPQIIGTYIAKDLDDAVKQYKSENPKVHFDNSGKGEHSYWGCAVFTNINH